ncbi:GNAT family N-acetyltransferase [Streptomyces sioyaensis]|uniref:GNAT family N-acetyltransferase n=1 Tax=Streptomyces sioyaensis TaxID=67364 RepID=UPI0037D2725A
MVSVTDVNGLTTAQVGHWHALYDQFGTRIQQSPAYTQALNRAGERVLVAIGRDTVFPFTREGSMCRAVCHDLPFLSTEQPGQEQLSAVLAQVRLATGLPVYLPLAAAGYAEVGGMEREDGRADIDGEGEFRTWPRLANSVIDWSLDGADLWERALRRGTSQLTRKRRLVERDGLTLRLGRSGHEAAQDTLTVDDNSWKATRGQSMRQRGWQGMVYSALIRSGVLTATFLYDQDRPVAFRLDSRVKDRVMCLKWSYDEAYKRYSPGLYLLTEGLIHQWGGAPIRTIDLFGSPDSLKNLLYSERLPRVDIWYGNPKLGAELAADRLLLDKRVTQAQTAGKGIRHAYA